MAYTFHWYFVFHFTLEKHLIESSSGVPQAASKATTFRLNILSKFSQAQANVGFKIDVFYKWLNYELFDYTLIRLQIYSTKSLQIVWLQIYSTTSLQIDLTTHFLITNDPTTNCLTTTVRTSNYPTTNCLTTNYPTTSWFDYKLTVKLIHNMSDQEKKAFLA